MKLFFTFLFLLSFTLITPIRAQSESNFENQAVDKLQLFPNPVGDILYLKSKVPIESVTIYNILGQMIFKKDVDVANTQLDISHFASGQYLIKATVNGQSDIYKFVKQ